MRDLLHKDWHAVAGIVAAVAALVLHLLHIVDQATVLLIILVILALIMIRDLHREDRDETVAETLETIGTAVEAIHAGTRPRELDLIGPRQLAGASERFARQARGNMIWYNVCLLMFVPQQLFDRLLRPAVENPRVTDIQFILDERDRDLWREQVMPKLEACSGREKVRPPVWTSLERTLSFILADIDETDEPDALASFWGRPFMARTQGGDVPRYVLHVRSHSDLIQRFIEIEREHRLGRGSMGDGDA